MKVWVLVVLITLSVFAGNGYASCQHPRGNVPEIPNPETATERQMMEARLKVEQYVAQAESFARCSQRSSDKRAERTLKRAARLAKKYNQAHHIYQQRNIQ